eukprot:scaffold8457_cov112-Isochrysis_galbana.AAC.8
MCVWTRAGCKSYSASNALTSGISSYQMPNDDDGPPTLVLPVPPEPRPGLKRRPSWSVRSPRLTSPYERSCLSEQALNLMPSASRSARSCGVCCDDSEMRDGSTPAATARRTSYPDDASMCRPIRSNV